MALFSEQSDAVGFSHSGYILLCTLHDRIKADMVLREGDFRPAVTFEGPQSHLKTVCAPCDLLSIS